MIQTFNQIKNLNVLVIGDVILDKYCLTEVNRISPESPIPVARFLDEKLTLGGAANVALNIANLGAKTYLIGQIGTDKEGSQITSITKKNKINFMPVVTPSKTITKTRITSKGAQLLRLDHEDKDFKVNSKQVIKEIKNIIKKIDVIIVSDYQKGLLSEDVIKFIKKQKKYTAIDTKPGTFVNFKGFNLIKPNFTEAVGIAQKLGDHTNYKNTDDHVKKLGKFLKQKLKSNILITRSEEGASYVADKTYHNKIEIAEVTDVTGAGDTSISIFSLLDYLKVPKEDCLEIMNAAAKVSISHLGTYAPTIEEIKNELYKEEFDNVLTIDKLIRLRENLKQQGKKVVFTNGCFDLIHKGHITYLKEAKKYGDILIVGLNADKSPYFKTKGPNRPVVDEASRAFVLSNLDPVDYVVIFDDETPIETIKKIKPDIHVKGGDYTIDQLPEAKVVKSYGGKIKLLSLVKGHSTTSMIEKSKKNG